MGEVITLRNALFDPDTDTGRAFIVDATRAAEGLISDRELAEKYELSPADWQAIVKDAAIGRAIRAERERRVFAGTAARESAAKHFARAPTILAGIMENALSNPRHIIEASRELRTTASGGSSESQPASERFIIRIDLSAGGGEVMTFDKSIKIDAADGSGPDGDSPDSLIALEGNIDVYE